jgi:hypothetical protein
VHDGKRTKEGRRGVIYVGGMHAVGVQMSKNRSRKPGGDQKFMVNGWGREQTKCPDTGNVLETM